MSAQHLTAEVRECLHEGKAIVALESTIIAHGMPYPHNLEVAHALEETVRSHGAVPATIAILNGFVKIGLTESELQELAESKDVQKVASRDIPFVLVKKWRGATTVSATMRLAEMAGIKIFATGGIGGVHRNAAHTFDVSSDLIELSRSNVAVVSAGAKAILDLPLTLEYLETHGVPVIGYQTEFFPAFYSRSSGIRLQQRLDTVAEIAHCLNVKWNLGIKGGVLIANPIPTEAELPVDAIEPHIATALQEAEKRNILGKEITPFLLHYLNELSGNKSQLANKTLALNNAKLAASISVEFAAHTNKKPAIN